MIMVLMVEEILDGAGVEYRVMELTNRAVSVDDVIQFSKGEINPGEICKTIIVKSRAEFTALFLRGLRQDELQEAEGSHGEGTYSLI